MRGWRETKLGEVVKTISETYKFTHENVVFLNTSDIYLGKVINHKKESPKGLPGQAKKRIQKNDLLFSEIRPANGRWALIDFDSDDYVVSTKLMVLRCQDGIIPNYLKLFLTSREQLDYLQMLAEDRSGTFPQITFDHIASLDILLPPLPEQKAIAGVLSSLDDKIDLLHRQNKTLEAMAETLWRKMFVEDEDKSWDDKKLGQLCTITRGASPRPIIDYVVNGTVPWIKIADGSRDGDFFIDRTNEFIIEEGVSKSVKVFPGDLILSNSATCGFPYFVEIEGCIHDGWLLFRDFKEISNVFLFFFLKNIFLELNYIADGSVQNNLNTSMLKDYPAKLPPAKLLMDFDEKASAFLSKIKDNIHQIRTIEALRDTLLPKLMGGEIFVDHKEGQVKGNQ